MLTVPSPTTVTECDVGTVSLASRAITAGAGDAVFATNTAIRIRVIVATKPIAAFAENFAFIIQSPIETQVFGATTGDICTTSMTTLQPKEFHSVLELASLLPVLRILKRVIGSSSLCLLDFLRI